MKLEKVILIAQKIVSDAIKKTDLSASALAKKAGLDSATITRFFDKNAKDVKSAPNFKTILSILEISGLSFENFLTCISGNKEKEAIKNDVISFSEQRVKFMLEAQITASICPQKEKDLLIHSLQNASHRQLENCVSGLIQMGLQKSDEIIPWLESIFDVHFEGHFRNLQSDDCISEKKKAS